MPTPDDVVQVTAECAIPLDELSVRFGPSGGPGGQHANRSNTRVEVRFDVAASPSLGPRQRARLLERLGPVVRVTASERRSQHQNRELALERLKGRLASALHVPRARRPTKPSRTANAKRLDSKRRQSAKKQARRLPPDS